MRRRHAVVVLLLAGCLPSACGGSAPAAGAPATTAAQTAPNSWSIVALGDSVPRGTNCHCTPYPPLTASGVAASSGKTVTATNDAVGGATTASVLDQINSNADVIAHLRKARVVEIEIGANDVGYRSSCGTNAGCYAPEIPTIQNNLDAIVGRVHGLASGHKLLVVLLDYWSVWLGGKYAAAKGEAYVDAAAEVTDQVNDVIKSTAAKTGSQYVDLRAAFKGPDYAYDETRYLAPDGDHPNAAGHEQIAKATEAVIEQALGL